MKKLVFTTVIIFITIQLFGQVSGNVNYLTPQQNKMMQRFSYPENNINTPFPNSTDVNFSIKGLANVKADAYVAIFNITQTGKTASEVNEKMDERIEKAINRFTERENAEIYIDMISFVPMYEFEVEKKIFSKTTYNEVPAGFELQKNIHIKYTDPNLMNEIISEFSKEEIYDLVKVDYFSSQLEAIKKELMAKAKVVMEKKFNQQTSVLSIDFKEYEKQMVDGFKIKLPVEMYKSYQAYNNSSLTFDKKANVNNMQKANNLYYEPIIDKEFDFVINPTVLEPVIQVMYEIKVRFVKPKEKPIPVEKSIQKQYFIITPTGDVKPLPVN